MNILFHGAYIGTTGYNVHTRNIVRNFIKKYPEHKVRVRNFTVGKNFKGYSQHNLHDNEEYLDNLDKKILHTQTLMNGKELIDYPIYEHDYNFKEDINIILAETSHHYFYQKYDGFKIAYCVWETSKLNDDFFSKLNEYDQVWVVSNWQKSCLIHQGMETHKIKIVPEGVDTDVYFSHTKKQNDILKYVLIGRWDYRKSTKEIIQTFIKTFKKINNVELICLVDNPYAIDELNSTEERFDFFNIEDNKVKIEHFKSYNDYISLLKNTDVYISCSRSEGWNLPLIECMSMGIPSLYSNWSGQLEFASGCGIPVKVKDFRVSNLSKETYNQSPNGYFCEPDFDDLSRKLLDVYNNYDKFNTKAKLDSEMIHKYFSWEEAAKIMYENIEKIDFVDVDLFNIDKKTRLEIRSWLNINEIEVIFYKDDLITDKFNLKVETSGYVWVEVSENSWNKLIIKDSNNKSIEYTQ